MSAFSLIFRSLLGKSLPEFCAKYRIEALKAFSLKRSRSDYDPQTYSRYGEDQNYETSFKGKALQAAVDSWCKIQSLTTSKPITKARKDENTKFKPLQCLNPAPKGRA
jgi:hypothetical protein